MQVEHICYFGCSTHLRLRGILQLTLCIWAQGRCACLNSARLYVRSRHEHRCDSFTMLEGMSSYEPLG